MCIWKVRLVVYVLFATEAFHVRSRSTVNTYLPMLYDSDGDMEDAQLDSDTTFDYYAEENLSSSPGFISLNINPSSYETDTVRPFNSFLYFDELLKRTKSGSSSPVRRKIYKRFYDYVKKPPEKLSVSRDKMGLFPYNNVVKLSSGCTGTLLSPTHVLTAAHCVHDGTEFKQHMEMLKVEVTDTIGYRIHYITKISVPVMWLKTQSLPEMGRGAFDYAVLKLNIPVRGRDKFMQLSLPTIKALNSDIDFLGFTHGHSSTLWLSTCDAEENILYMRGNIVLRRCKSSAGNSGAAAFTNSAVEGNKIIGILSNAVSSGRKQLSGDNNDLEAIMLLTFPKCLDICAMIHPYSENYDVCETVKRQNVQYIDVGSSRIMPFFG